MSQKLPLTRSLRKGMTNVALDTSDKEPKEYPCTVVAVNQPFVTVKFDVTGVMTQPVEMPVAMSAYVRLPIQIGDKGMAVSGTASLAALTGLGVGTADTVQQANLSNLVFVPISGKYFAVVDGTILFLSGPGGVTIRDTANTTQIELIPGVITLSAGGHSITIDATGITLDGTLWAAHVHTDVTSGTSDSGPIPP